MPLHNLLFTFEAVFALGVLIFVHELGHFLVAKASGIRVETFSLGFGPKLFGFTHGGTLYKISVFPLGGYVKPAGEVEEKRSYQPDEFLSKPWYIRAAVLFAGPSMNFIFPVLLLFVLYSSVGKPLSLGPATIQRLMDGKPAAEVGLKPDDQILKVDQKDVASFQNLADLVDGQSRSHPGQPIELLIRRGKTQLQLKVQAALDKNSGRYRIGVEVGPGPAPTKRVVERVLVGTPAEKAGFLAGDEIIKVDGKDLPDGLSFPAYFADSLHDPVPVEILRGGKDIVLKVPKKQPVPEKFDRPEELGLLGLELQSESALSFQRLKPSTALELSLLENVNLAMGMVYGITSLVTGHLSFKESVGGPITIMRMAHQQAKSGFIQFLDFICRISIMLCIMNLLPVPLLDGGTLVLCFLEGVRGKALSTRSQLVLQNIGIALLVSLMLFATYNDIVNWVIQTLRNASH